MLLVLKEKGMWSVYYLRKGEKRGWSWKALLAVEWSGRTGGTKQDKDEEMREKKVLSEEERREKSPIVPKGHN